MSRSIPIVMFGGTGYIGGSVLSSIIRHPRFSEFDVKALVRSEAKASKLRAFGITPVLGEFTDYPILEKLAAEGDIVINCGMADDVLAVQAILKGIKSRHGATGVVPEYIHTSGTGIFADQAKGDFAPAIPHDDTKADDIALLSSTNFHRNVDEIVVAADKEGYLKSYIVLPPCIYGLPQGPAFEAGIQNSPSTCLRMMAQFAIARGNMPTLGAGKNVWDTVHINEVANLYSIIFSRVLENTPTDHGHNGYYNASSGATCMGDVNKVIAENLVSIGKLKSADMVHFTEVELTTYPSLAIFGTNAHCISNHSYSVGWKPVEGAYDIYKCVPEEVANMFAK